MTNPNISQRHLLSNAKGNHSATKISEMNRRKSLLKPRSDSMLIKNVVDMKRYVKAKSKLGIHRDNEDLKKDLLLHRQQVSETLDKLLEEEDESQLYMIADREDGSFRLNGNSKHRYAKDYVTLANDYRRMESYRCNNPSAQVCCVLCSAIVPKLKSHNDKVGATKVFFPCEHLCLCDACYSNKASWDNCPLCNDGIKVTFDHNGNEVEEYWCWVNELKPPLASSFKKSFPRLSRKAIVDAMARSIEGIDEEETNVSKSKIGSMADLKTSDKVVHSVACIIS
jgi:hypothetical protein